MQTFASNHYATNNKDSLHEIIISSPIFIFIVKRHTFDLRTALYYLYTFSTNEGSDRKRRQ